MEISLNFIVKHLDTNIRIKSFTLNVDDNNEFNALYTPSVLKNKSKIKSRTSLAG